MRIIIIVIASLLIGFASGYFWFGDTEAQSISDGAEKTQLYTCGMHPEVISSEPGVCPICHMKLIPKREGTTSSGGVVIDPTSRQNMGLTTTLVRRQTLSKTIRAFGKVTVADPNVYNVNLKIPGWVEKLHVNEQGDRVVKGQPLLEIYSPELLTAQREYLAAISNADNAEDVQRLAQMSETRMRNWDVAEDQLTSLKNTGAISRTALIRAPVDGFVIQKHVNTGDKVAANMALYEIADLSSVWVKAYVYEQDLPYLSLNQQAIVSTPGLPGRTFNSRVVYISPALNPQGQVEIRLQLQNPDFVLRPEMYANVVLEHQALHERLIVPRSAVINSGAKQVVYIAAADDTFLPKMVTTGAIDDDDMIEIISGLGGDETVVTSGQFLIDSETRLNEALGSMAGHGHGTSAMSADKSSSRHDNHGDKADLNLDPYDIHTCPMPEHYHVLNYGPGNCPECGMKLVPVVETDNEDVYVCPMPEDRVVQPDSGQCPVCNMSLIRYEPGAGHAE